MDSTSASIPLWINYFLRSDEYGTSVRAIEKKQEKETEEPSFQGVSSSMEEPSLKISFMFSSKNSANPWLVFFLPAP